MELRETVKLVRGRMFFIITMIRETMRGETRTVKTATKVDHAGDEHRDTFVAVDLPPRYEGAAVFILYYQQQVT